MLGGILGIVVGGFVIGALARLALPGPDPLPVWLTIALGAVGSVVGGFVTSAVVAPPNENDPEGVGSVLLVYFAAATFAATVILILYRRVVQKRPITGPDAHRLPLRARGLNRIARREEHRFVADTADADSSEPTINQLVKLVALRDAGKIDADEFERRKAALVAAL